MSQNVKINKYAPVGILAISCTVVFSLFLLQGNKEFNLWDEGFLWYGVQRALLNEVPILDFMAYDPGRYYWSAALLSIVDDNGIMGLRATVAIFQALGLFVGLWLIADTAKGMNKGSIPFLLISAAILAAWMFPRHKLFDVSLSIFLIGTLTYLVTKPVPKCYFIAGAGVGLVACFGRNHGVYGLVGSLGLIAWLEINKSGGPGCLKGILLWSAGIVSGFLPIILMVLLIPGFAIAYGESILILFEQAATNLPLPVPWPWTVDFSTKSLGDAIRGVLVGSFFIGTLIFAGLSITWVIRQRLNGDTVPAALSAAAFLSLPYAHFAFSRPDVAHLAQGIFPLLIGCLAIISTLQARLKWCFAIALCSASIWVMHAHHAGWGCWKSGQCVNVDISGSTLQISPSPANDIALVRRLTEQFAPDGQSFIVTPFWPGAYALMERKSPVWETYALQSRIASFERREIERIKEASPSFVLVVDLALDGRDELRFENTHPLTHQYFLDSFEQVHPTPHPMYKMFIPKGREN